MVSQSTIQVVLFSVLLFSGTCPAGAGKPLMRSAKKSQQASALMPTPNDKPLPEVPVPISMDSTGELAQVAEDVSSSMEGMGIGSTGAFVQVTEDTSSSTKGKPLMRTLKMESHVASKHEPVLAKIISLKKEHKKAQEDGNYELAKELDFQIHGLTPEPRAASIGSGDALDESPGTRHLITRRTKAAADGDWDIKSGSGTCTLRNNDGSDCTLSAGCACIGNMPTSANVLDNTDYANSESCVFDTPTSGVLTVEQYTVEGYFDYLTACDGTTVDTGSGTCNRQGYIPGGSWSWGYHCAQCTNTAKGNALTGNADSLQDLALSGRQTIAWTSDAWVDKAGWLLCVGASAQVRCDVPNPSNAASGIGYCTPGGTLNEGESCNTACDYGWDPDKASLSCTADSSPGMAEGTFECKRRCTPPSGVSNAMSQPCSELLSTFGSSDSTASSSSTCTPRCNTNYQVRLSGGATQMTCTNQVWSPSTFECESATEFKIESGDDCVLATDATYGSGSNNCVTSLGYDANHISSASNGGTSGVATGSWDCYTGSGGSHAQNGCYQDSKSCEITTPNSGTLKFVDYDTESYSDYLSVKNPSSATAPKPTFAGSDAGSPCSCKFGGSTDYCSNSWGCMLRKYTEHFVYSVQFTEYVNTPMTDLPLSERMTMTWTSDYASVRKGWKVCADSTSLLEKNEVKVSKSTGRGQDCTFDTSLSTSGDEKPCGNVTGAVVPDGTACTPTCTEGEQTATVSFTCQDGAFKDSSGATVSVADMTCQPINPSLLQQSRQYAGTGGTRTGLHGEKVWMPAKRTKPWQSLLEEVPNVCTIPTGTENPNEKLCGNETEIQNGETCSPTCSAGYAAKDDTFTCVAGVLKDSSGAEATAADLTCEPISTTAPASR